MDLKPYNDKREALIAELCDRNLASRESVEATLAIAATRIQSAGHRASVSRLRAWANEVEDWKARARRAGEL